MGPTSFKLQNCIHNGYAEYEYEGLIHRIFILLYMSIPEQGLILSDSENDIDLMRLIDGVVICHD